MLALTVPLSLCTTVPRIAHAQIGLSGGAMAFPVTRRLSYQGTVRDQTGMFIGAEGSVRLGKLALGVSGFFGKVTGDSSQATNPDLSMRVSDLWVRFQASPWLGLGASAEGRRHQSAVGVTAWRLMGPTVWLSPGLGVRGLTGTAEMTYFASASVIGGGESISPAIRATLGAAYAPGSGKVELRVGYRFERFDFAASGSSPARLEQFSGILAGIGVRLGKGS